MIMIEVSLYVPKFATLSQQYNETSIIIIICSNKIFIG